MSDICSDFRASAAYIHKWVTSQPEVKEESLTDWLLYDVDIRRPDVIYKAFSRHEEARETGADWEWWFVFIEGAVRLRVQAKKLHSTKDNYPGLAHTNKYGLQIDKLIADATIVNAFPVYAFYSSSTSASKCPLDDSIPSGVHVAGAAMVEQALLSARRHVSEGDAIALSTPLPCLMCCPLSSNTMSVSTLLRYLRRYLATDQGDEVSNHMPGHYESLPPFVSSLLEQEGKIPDWWESEFAREITGVKGILITDLRANNSSKPKPLRGSA